MAEVELNFPAPPLWENRVEAPFSSDTTKALSKPQLDVEAESRALAEKEKAPVDAKAALATDTAKIELAGAQAKETRAAQNIVDKSKVDDVETAKVAKRAEALRIANDEIRATPAVALMADRKGWDKAKLAIGLALAGLGDAMNAKASATLGRAAGPSAVTDVINMDLDRQRANLKKLTDVQIMAKEGVKDAIEARELALSKVDLAGAALFALASQHLETQLKAKGLEAPAIAANEAKLAIDRAEVESKKRAVADLANTHTRTGQKVENVTRAQPDGTSGGKGQMAMVRNSNGTDAGPAPAAAAAKVNEETVLRSAAVRALKHFDQVAREVGGRAIVPGTKDFNMLKGAHADAVAAITSVTNMPGTDKSSLVEAERLGPTGSGVWKVEPKLIRNLAGAIREQGLHAIKMTANSALQTRKNGETVAPGLPVRPTANPAPAAPAPGPVAPAGPIAPAGPATPPVAPPPPPAAAVAPPPPRAPGQLSPADRAALQWAYGAGRGDPRAEEIKRRLGVK